MKQIKIQSPAKVNLYLRIAGRRADGYHLLDTLFHRISLADTLMLSKRKAGFSFSSNAKLPVREGNLLFKAYCALHEKMPSLGGVRAKLIKRIPIGAGLGGGSSNAAFFLRGMIQLYRLKITTRELMAVGLKVGADVPFFLLNKNQARATGIGEKLKVLPSRQKYHFLLITDPQPLATVAVYKNYYPHPRGVKTHIRGARVGCRTNDLQASAIALRPSIAKVLGQLGQMGAESVLMSGSGPTVFAVATKRQSMEALKQRLPANLKKRAILCHSL